MFVGTTVGIARADCFPQDGSQEVQPKAGDARKRDSLAGQARLGKSSIDDEQSLDRAKIFPAPTSSPYSAPHAATHAPQCSSAKSTRPKVVSTEPNRGNPRLQSIGEACIVFCIRLQPEYQVFVSIQAQSLHGQSDTRSRCQ